MHPRIRAVILAAAALVVIVPSSGAAAQAARSGPSMPRTTVSQQLTWAIVPSPNNPVEGNVFQGISCPSASSCTAVGFYYHRDGVGKPLVESWNGSGWSIVPVSGRPSYNYLKSVSCPSVSACIAVGYSYGRHSEPKTMVESWNGTAWSVVPSPNPGTRLGQDYLTGVSCTSASACIAVGYYHVHKLKTLVESWNGTAWSVVPSPSPDVSDVRPDYLNGVTCLSATACTAVGNYAKGTLVETWNGTTWSVVPSPNPASGGGILYSVSCATADACMAVGNDASAAALAEAWNGSTWSVVPTPGVGSSNQLGGVWCTAADACNAVGDYSSSTSGPVSTLAEAWDGSTWSVVPSPNAPGTNINSFLEGVSCASAAMCMAEGGISSNRSNAHWEKTLTELGTSSG